MPQANSSRKKIVILGFGHLGEFLYTKLLTNDEFEIVGLWNRTRSRMIGKVPDKIILNDIEDSLKIDHIDLFIEVAHPHITRDYGSKLVRKAPFLIGSPTALADQTTREVIKKTSETFGHAVFVAKGALWGAQDIKAMSTFGQLKALTVTMSKHPSCFRLHPTLEQKLDNEKRSILYDGTVSGLCPLAPNNVNTMAAAAIAAETLGFDGVRGVLISDPSLTAEHIVEIEAEGLNGFSVRNVRRNPAAAAAVTGTATFNSFYNSVVAINRAMDGINIV